MKTNAWISCLLCLGAMPCFAPRPVPADAVPADFARALGAATITATDARIAWSTGPAVALRVETGRKERWPGVTLEPAAEPWNLAQHEHVAVAVKNLGAQPLTIECRLDSPAGEGSPKRVNARTTLDPQAARTIMVRLYPTPFQLTEPIELIGMRRAPAEKPVIDPSAVNRLLIYTVQPESNHVFEITSIQPGGRIRTIRNEEFFPFIDEFGQFIHKDWPGKTHSLAELRQHTQAEERDIAAHSPSGWDQYGGWAAGPQLKATGFFRVEKREGNWWLVDPEGRLFWSHGIDCVRAQSATPITDREHYYRDLPAADSPFADGYSTSTRPGAHGYYQKRFPFRQYDFAQANLLRKYGDNWAGAFSDVTHRRLKSWGMNTIANWSEPEIYLQRRTPYTATISFRTRPIEGSEGYWGKFPDPFDPSFRESLRESLAANRNGSLGDPWCLGFFVHNELSWGDELSLAVASLRSPAEQAAKRAFIDDLKAKHGTLEKLNAAWGASHASWDALLQSTDAPDPKRARDDLAAFYTKIAEAYFRTIRDELKAVAPNQLYLGCRFAWVNDRAARAATKFCDVISYNRYNYSVADQRLPDGIDLPIIIGEFHFGALDRGMFHPGLRETATQQERADTYRRYVEGALRNPLIVGTHWFQYKDQATTGRSDGENYQIGFLDICDTPNPEIVGASRAIGDRLYEYRLKGE